MPKAKKLSHYELERQSHNEPISIKISTKVPSKWRFCDLETNKVYKWDELKKDFTIAELPFTFPNFGDKGNIMNKAREFTIDAENMLSAYNKCFEYDHSKPVDIIELGMNITRALDKFRSSLLFWKLDLDSWYRGLMIEQMISEYNNKKLSCSENLNGDGI